MVAFLTYFFLYTYWGHGGLFDEHFIWGFDLVFICKNIGDMVAFLTYFLFVNKLGSWGPF
ncbi:hypothetical protein T07_950 [Trichinella nelsoni]|uniref:Uncharacterized protein n=1 Tax=Trichinella nelsoni TaxID=6336 RepID=A0A0V0RCI9_9BILA|nr:hypothetical protein T07_950 [Trichinella nelsoni]